MRRKTEGEGSFRYRLSRPQLPENGGVFFISYRVGAGRHLEDIQLIGPGGRVLLQKELPVPPGSAEGMLFSREYRMPDLPSSDPMPIAEIAVQVSGTFDENRLAEFERDMEMGFRPPGEGIFFRTEETAVGPGFDLGWKGESIELSTVQRYPHGLELKYRWTPPSYSTVLQNGPVLIPVSAAQRGEAEKTASAADLIPRTGMNSVVLHPAVWDRSVQNIRINLPKAGFELVSLTPAAGPAVHNGPITLDGGGILRFAQTEWRREEFELFRWNLFPSVLVFDTRDYEVQTAFFKRLAFFVEKEGYIGKLMPVEDLRDKHGWNAHDYRAIDLASFFQAAADRRSVLGGRELELRTLLLENGILRYEGGVYLPGEGGVISISRETSDYLRRKFLVHEGFHGVFFVSEDFRRRCFELWDERSEHEKRFWKDFFSLMNYGTDNEYLVVNEYQAYLLQQPVSEADEYFRNHWAYRNLAGGTDMFADIPFSEAAGRMEEAVYSLFGLFAGEVFDLDNFE